MTKARRSPWLNDRAGLLVRLLADHGLSISELTARQDISDYLDAVAARMRIDRQAAKPYVSDDVIRGIADRIAAIIDNHGRLVDLDAERRRRRG
ncbi:hypothetical protein [Mycobacterium sp. MUNTM1]